MGEDDVPERHESFRRGVGGRSHGNLSDRPPELHLLLLAGLGDDLDDLSGDLHLFLKVVVDPLLTEVRPVRRVDGEQLAIEVLIDRLREVRCNGRDHSRDDTQAFPEHPVRGELLAILTLLPRAGANELHVPSREVVQDEFLEEPARAVEVVLLHLVREGGLHVLEAGQDPLVLRPHRGNDGVQGVGPRIEVVHGHVRGRELVDVPQDVEGPLRARDPILDEVDVLPGRVDSQEEESKGVGPELVNRLDGIDVVSEGLVHLAPVRTVHPPVHEDALVWRTAEGHRSRR